jgi:hypothetical protein
VTGSTVGYTGISSGNASFLRAFPIPLASDIELVAKETEIEYESIQTIDVFSVDKRPKAMGMESIAVAGIILFIGSWFAKKLLDEIYDLKLKPVIRRAIQRADEVIIFGAKKHSLIFLVGIYHRDKEKLVLVAVKTKDKTELLSGLEKIKDVHAIARQKVEMLKYHAPLHLYVIENGKVNIEPIQLDNMQEAYERIGA